jgi:hypothetical protein
MPAGHLTGFNRFRNAMLAGEVPDPQWVVDDHSWNYLQILMRELVADQSVQLGKRTVCTRSYGV